LHTGTRDILGLRREEKAKDEMTMQSRSATLRQELESRLASRIPAALSPRVTQLSEHMTSPGDSHRRKTDGWRMIAASRHFDCDKRSTSTQTRSHCESRCGIASNSYPSSGKRLSALCMIAHRLVALNLMLYGKWFSDMSCGHQDRHLLLNLRSLLDDSLGVHSWCPRAVHQDPKI
jgi:hypothetical protein